MRRGCGAGGWTQTGSREDEDGDVSSERPKVSPTAGGSAAGETAGASTASDEDHTKPIESSRLGP
ncbi:hypothetical protein EKH57_03100 [Halorubrum sp. BOL3-1]|uniref:hypothetical protein n=1 Tax=Halorubrum sp. BOL3-1 TaxID=2497325 RepID=UPI0010050578|nr:hypothetical protein [Halorubrum sp. BOL3-1]QAU11822.1 hypothetical protein EKH57_03100 [Halorubrum sp. BOL3-1]